ncbi:MAG: aminopeptidase [Lachnospiraceae bacterium]|nr:aminopeptidase [Lachnospiraceae bacterium]MDY5742614.1 aminopeptidase [Lachnospiraceae bacterium]
MYRKNAWKDCSEQKKTEVFAFAEQYKGFLSDCKTERECVTYMVEEIQRYGYRDLQEVLKQKGGIKPQDKLYVNWMGKALMMFHIGERGVDEGMNILGAHIDSPRIDLKQNPLYESEELAMLDTHYYGGVKKYQWLALPLALHGVVAKKDGSLVEVRIGEKPEDPVLGLSDLLIHLSADQLDKKARVVVEGETLNVLIGSIPAADTDQDAVKANILQLLKECYGMEEEDFVSAELEIVPAGAARDYGLDRSMVMGYGHDDRICAFPSYRALLAVEQAEYTNVCLLVDKEEIGSVGATGMTSRIFENTVAEILFAMGKKEDIYVRRALQRSVMLSSDVSAAFDPNFPEVMEKKNSAFFGYGMTFNKYTGSRGKAGSNDANAEYMARLRRVMDEKNIAYQTAELGKVDQGGGGTIAYILAEYGMEVIDSGVAVLNMHAPWEIASKIDLYETYRGYVAFLQSIRQ